jgi:hypothetical protein
MNRRSTPLRRRALGTGWCTLCCCAPVVSAQTVTTGPGYFVGPISTFKVGANGRAGTDANGDGGKCRSGPAPGIAGQAGPTISTPVTSAPGQSPYPGTIIAAGSSGGTGGAGGSGDHQGECGKGDFYAMPGGAGVKVQITLDPGPGAPVGGCLLGNTGVLALSHGGSGGKGGDNTRAKGPYSAGNGGAAGNASTVSVTKHVALKVSGGAGAFGFVAKRAGGQGGQGGQGGESNNGKAKGGSGLPGGAGNTLTITNTAAIGTDGGIAIAAQSIGGFGGNAGRNTSGYGGGGGYGGGSAVDFLTRTREHVSTEMSLHVLAYNLKLVLRVLGPARTMKAMKLAGA